MGRTWRQGWLGSKYCSMVSDKSRHHDYTRASRIPFLWSYLSQPLLKKEAKRLDDISQGKHCKIAAIKRQLTERLIDLIEELLLEFFIFDKLADTCQTLGNLIGRQSSHQVEDGLLNSLRIFRCLSHFVRFILVLFVNRP